MEIEKNNDIYNIFYNNLIKDYDKSLARFTVFENNKFEIRLPIGHGKRSQIIDKLISYFEQKELYEKCSELVKLKQDIIKLGN